MFMVYYGNRMQIKSSKKKKKKKAHNAQSRETRHKFPAEFFQQNHMDNT